MKQFLHLFLTLLALLACSPTASSQRRVGSIDVPSGFSRVEAGDFGSYLRGLPLKPEGSVVRLYNGLPKVWQRGAYAVIDMEIGEKDLQQCAGDAHTTIFWKQPYCQARISEHATADSE